MANVNFVYFYVTFSIINCLNSSALQEWVQLEEAVQHDIVPGFGKKITAILDKCLAGSVFFLFGIFLLKFGLSIVVSTFKYSVLFFFHKEH